MKRRNGVFAALLAVMALASACDRTEQAADLTGSNRPQFNMTDDGVKILKTRAPLGSNATWVTQTPVSAQGGVMFFGTHSLLVPQGAVSSPTHFSAMIHAGEVIKVDLRAWDTDGTPVSTFAVPVQLTLDLTSVADYIPDWSQVVVVYHNPNGTLEIMPSVPDQAGKKVTATLGHFSDYSPGWGRGDSIPPMEP